MEQEEAKAVTAFIDVLRTVKERIAALKTIYIISAGLITGLCTAVFNASTKKSERWAYYSVSAYTKVEDLFESCTSLRRSFPFLTHVKGQPFHGSLTMHKSNCDNDLIFAEGSLRLENQAENMACTAKFSIIGNSNVVSLKASDFAPIEGLTCFPDNWEVDVWVIRKEHLVIYYRQFFF